MSEQQTSNSGKVKNGFEQTADKIITDLSSDKFCLKNCVDISHASSSAKESECFNNCLNTYNQFINSYEKNFHLN
jgi:hypothetical protein